MEKQMALNPLLTSLVAVRSSRSPLRPHRAHCETWVGGLEKAIMVAGGKMLWASHPSTEAHGT